MSLIKSIKESAKKNRTIIQSSDASELQNILNRAFLLPKKQNEEMEFLSHILSRGSINKERTGQHASDFIKTDGEFCIRSQILCLFFRQSQGTHHPISLLRIFEEGNSVHEKWQRLFIRAGHSSPLNLDQTCFDEKFSIKYTPDIICRIPEFYDGLMIGEIKSVNTFQFQKMISHPTAKKQLQWYMYLSGIHKGFVLCEDKNTQDIKLEIYVYDESVVKEYLDRASFVKGYFNKINEAISSKSKVQPPPRPLDAKTSDCKRCLKCNMQLTCWNLPGGCIPLNG